MVAPVAERTRNLSSKIVRPLIESIDVSVKRQRWSNEELEEKFAKRNAREIIDDGNTHYISPCLDLTLVTLQLLKERGFDTTFLIEELKYPSSEDIKLHFAVEFNEGRDYVNYTIANNAIIGRGSYSSFNKIPTSLSISRFDGRDISYLDNICSILGICSLTDLDKIHTGFSFPKQLTKMKRNNTPEIYNKYLEFFGWNPHWNIAEL